MSPIEIKNVSAAPAGPAGVCAFIYSPDLEIGGYPKSCPFNTHRAGRVRALLNERGLLSDPRHREVAPVPATEAELLRFHRPEYVAALKDAQEGRYTAASAAMGLGTPDCPIFPGMYDYVRLAVGGSLTAARLILSSEAFIAFNPSGGFHHAQAGRASGFCYLNDVVLAAMELADAGRRVAILDLDVHHGDGQQIAFYERNDVLTVSLHESGRTLFPGTGFEDEIGRGPGRGYCVNIPLPVGTYDEIYEYAFLEAALPVLRAFDPDVILMELGMDTLAGDPLAHLNLTNNVIAKIVERVRDLGKPVLAVGGGGYHLPNTVRGWALCWSVLVGGSVPVHDLGLGVGGQRPDNTYGLRDLHYRALLTDAGRRVVVDAEVHRVVDFIRKNVFPLHKLA